MKEQTDSHASCSEDIAKRLKPDDRVWVKLEKQGKPPLSSLQCTPIWCCGPILCRSDPTIY
jgi:hypothetical protein